ncbi:F-box/FBD/LRR-repeat protein At1g13570-like [Tasmannia lanceolata]|uniref:F-box/FBD/LRR-repeat protein At1g13570-like n=1 Tax=Tasmannia lanceolata TaxID=3420 RepID=UPI004062A369
MEVGQASTFDVISNLPRDAIDAILVRLPLKDANRGSIHKFKCIRCPPACSDFDRWVLFLSRHGIKELILDFYGAELYKLPSCFFSCQELYNLRLESCIFDIPLSFEGFSRLKSLELIGVVISSDELQCLISKSPFLESLTYIEDNDPCPKINIPKLRYLYLGGAFELLCVENTPVEELGMHKILSCLRNVEVLRMHNQFLQDLAVGDVPEMVPNTFEHLKRLSLRIDFKNGKEISAILCLLRSSHLLKELEIRIVIRLLVSDSDTPSGIRSELEQNLEKREKAEEEEKRGKRKSI